MENLDLLVLRRLLGWREAGHRAVLVTVTRTWGSSPRPVGSIMALCDDGAAVGSVSGGCIEDDLVHRFGGGALPEGLPQVLRYGLTADEAHRFGLPCGGTLELVLEFNPGVDALRALVTRLDRGRLVRRTLDLGTGRVALDEDREAAFAFDGGCLRQVFGPAWRLLLIGAGQLAEYLATMAVFSGFDVSVCDPRDTYAGHWRVPHTRLLKGMPDDEVLAFGVDARSAIVALTHDPKLDDLALLEALRSPAFYVGAIGSRRNQAARRERLAVHFGLSDAELRRLHGPIGLPIGSKTPAEIAISVMAQIVSVRNGAALAAGATVQADADG